MWKLTVITWITLLIGIVPANGQAARRSNPSPLEKYSGPDSVDLFFDFDLLDQIIVQELPEASIENTVTFDDQGTNSAMLSGGTKDGQRKFYSPSKELYF